MNIVGQTIFEQLCLICGKINVYFKTLILNEKRTMWIKFKHAFGCQMCLDTTILDFLCRRIVF